MKLIGAAYSGINNVQMTEQVFKSVDTKQIGYLNPEQFFDACEAVFWMKAFTTSLVSNKCILKLARII